VALIRQIITHPKIYPWLGDDGMPPAAQFQPVDHPEIHYMLVWDGSELLGLFEFRPKNSVTWEAHTCLLPNAWGARAVTAAREMARWTFDNTSCERIVTAVPEYNRLARKLAIAAGFSQWGRDPDSWRKKQKLHAVLYFGLSKRECRP